MREEWGEDTELFAAGTNCPMPDCGELALTYRAADSTGKSAREPWEFTCPRCGIEFFALEEDLLFRSIRKDWFWTGIHAA